jgi:hypothetical protein
MVLKTILKQILKQVQDDIFRACSEFISGTTSSGMIFSEFLLQDFDNGSRFYAYQQLLVVYCISGVQ